MKKVTYHCNLCREKKERTEIIAMYYKCDIIPQRYVLDKSKIDECDNHICEQCISIIMVEGQKALLTN